MATTQASTAKVSYGMCSDEYDAYRMPPLVMFPVTDMDQLKYMQLVDALSTAVVTLTAEVVKLNIKVERLEKKTRRKGQPNWYQSYH